MPIYNMPINYMAIHTWLIKFCVQVSSMEVGGLTVATQPALRADRGRIQL